MTDWNRHFVVPGVDLFGLSVGYGGYVLFTGSAFSGLRLAPGVYSALQPFLVHLVGWMTFFFFTGLYRFRFAESRLDEVVSLFKVTAIGTVGLFFFRLSEWMVVEGARRSLITYWALTTIPVALGRVVLRTVQKANLRVGGAGRRTALIGWDDEVWDLYERVQAYPQAGLEVVAIARLAQERGVLLPASADSFERQRLSDPDNLDTFGGDGGLGRPVGTEFSTPSRQVLPVSDVPALLQDAEVEEVLITSGDSDRSQELMLLLQYCDQQDVAVKLVPDLYTMMGGTVHTEHVYGLPLIDAVPQTMPVWERRTKRIIDIVISAAVLGFGFPLWLLLAALIGWTSSGGVIYSQKRVGLHGTIFWMYKFRTMRSDAEAQSGPVWAREDDTRYTRIGALLRRTRFDEIPQFWNVLKGDMSLVGPRPERPYFVEQLSREIPLYPRRHQIKPGITGLAQVSQGYTSTLDGVHEKIEYDLFYIENMSLLLDLKILLRTVQTAFQAEGQ